MNASRAHFPLTNQQSTKNWPIKNKKDHSSIWTSFTCDNLMILLPCKKLSNNTLYKYENLGWSFFSASSHSLETMSTTLSVWWKSSRLSFGMQSDMGSFLFCKNAPTANQHLYDPFDVVNLSMIISLKDVNAEMQKRQYEQTDLC